MEDKPGEKEFRSPDNRMEEAVHLYATISRHKLEYQEAVLKKKSDREGGTNTATADSSRGGKLQAEERPVTIPLRSPR